MANLQNCASLQDATGELDYRLTNHELYSDKFALSVVNLNQIELATEEDRKYGIDHWARLFKATTWEAIKKMAQAATASRYHMDCNIRFADKT